MALLNLIFFFYFHMSLIYWAMVGIVWDFIIEGASAQYWHTALPCESSYHAFVFRVPMEK